MWESCGWLTDRPTEHCCDWLLCTYLGSEQMQTHKHIVAAPVIESEEGYAHHPSVIKTLILSVHFPNTHIRFLLHRWLALQKTILQQLLPTVSGSQHPCSLTGGCVSDNPPLPTSTINHHPTPTPHHPTPTPSPGAPRRARGAETRWALFPERCLSRQDKRAL